jgi:hypothetical protein
LNGFRITTRKILKSFDIKHFKLVKSGMAFSPNQDLEGALPTTGLFSGNQHSQHMNIDPPPPPPMRNKCLHHDRIDSWGQQKYSIVK